MTPLSAWESLSVTDLSKRLNVTRAALYRWRHAEKGIPAERAVEIEKLTGVNRALLRPDLWSIANSIPAELAVEIERLTGVHRARLRPDLWGVERDNV